MEHLRAATGRIRFQPRRSRTRRRASRRHQRHRRHTDLRGAQLACQTGSKRHRRHPKWAGQVRRTADHEHRQPRVPLLRRARDPQAHRPRCRPSCRHRLPGGQRDEILRFRLRGHAAPVRQVPAREVPRRSGRAQPPLRPRLLVQPHRLLGGLPGCDRHHQRVPRRRIRQVPPRPGARLPAVAGRHRARIRA